MTLQSSMSASTVVRARVTYLALALTTIVTGLVVHLRGAVLGATARDMLGDALWAAMIAWWAGIVAPRARPSTRCVAAYAVCALVELSQRYHGPTIDGIRATQVGHLILGSGFDPRDFLAYALGVGAAGLIDAIRFTRQKS